MTTSTAARAGIVDRAIGAAVELHLTHRDVTSGRTAVRAPGRWLATTDTATVKTYESSVYDAAVLLYSSGVFEGWQVTVRQHGESVDVFDEPVCRDRAQEAARAEMTAIAEQHGGIHASA